MSSERVKACFSDIRDAMVIADVLTAWLDELDRATEKAIADLDAKG